MAVDSKCSYHISTAVSQHDPACAERRDSDCSECATERQAKHQLEASRRSVPSRGLQFALRAVPFHALSMRHAVGRHSVHAFESIPLFALTHCVPSRCQYLSAEVQTSLACMPRVAAAPCDRQSCELQLQLTSIVPALQRVRMPAPPSNELALLMDTTCHICWFFCNCSELQLGHCPCSVRPCPLSLQDTMAMCTQTSAPPSCTSTQSSMRSLPPSPALAHLLPTLAPRPVAARRTSAWSRTRHRTATSGAAPAAQIFR